MEINVGFSELADALSFANTVLSDKSVEERAKNFIFTLTGEGLVVTGHSPFVFSRTVIDSIETEGIPEDGWAFQVKASEMNKIIQSFSSLSKTSVSNVKFTDEGVRVGVLIHENPLDPENARLEQDSQFFLENAPISKVISTEIAMEFPQDYDVVDRGEPFVYFDVLFPIMSNDSQSSSSSKMNFAEDYVFVVTSSMSAFMKNTLPDAFKNMALSYSSIQFAKKLCQSTEAGISVAKNEKYLCMKAGDTEAFMKYQKVKINYKMYVDRRSKDTGLVIDRDYLKDVIKRLNSFSNDGEMKVIEGGDLGVSNGNFNQIIPVNKFKGEVEGIKFKVVIPVFDRAVLGDGVFTDELFMYFVPISRGYVLYISDKSGVWFSSMQVTK